LSLTYGDITVTEMGDVAEVALNQPIADEKIKKQLDKTKETSFYLESIQIDSAGDWFMPLGKLNELRRKAFEKLEEELNRSFLREWVPCKEITSEEVPQKKDKLELTVSVMSKEQLEAVVREPGVSSVFLHFSMLEQEPDLLDSDLLKTDKKFYVLLPTIFRRKTYENYKKKTHPVNQSIHHDNIDGFVVKNLEELEYLVEEQCNKERILDYNMYVMNRETRHFWINRGITEFTASLELNYQELKELDIAGDSMIVYGYTPLMTSAQCVVKNTAGCNYKSGYFRFVDKSGNLFYGRNFCSCCYNVIYNGKPLHLLEHVSDIEKLGVRDIRLDFTMESAVETKKILDCYVKQALYKEKTADCVEDYTKGHFKRGIE
ncbi:MAG TPA: hypothetical protein DCW90_21540, partial [Lachnospiraceae bacterium]|nr:hypothetical protein [Lachnospiraceae bacterium]